MTDPFNIATGVAGLLSFAYKLCRSIYDDIDKLSNAPKHLCDISRDLKALYTILSQLKDYLDDEATSPGLLHPITSAGLEAVLKNCVDIFERLSTILGQFRKDKTTMEMGAFLRIQAAWTESRIRDLERQLGAHKNTLSVVLSVAN
jgi:hypothetical protein